MAKNKGDNPQDKLINLQAQQLAAQIAQWAAQLEFQKERMRLLELPEMQGKLQIEIDRLAWDKAEAEAERAFKEAALTGTYNGQPTIEWLTQQAQLTGVLNGQQTLQGKLTDAQMRQMEQQMKLANDQFLVATTGYFNGQKTFDREKFEASQAQDAWKFIASLTGPSNAFRQARAIGSMPGGTADLMRAWAGQYATPGSTSVGSGGRASMWGLMEGFGGDQPYQYGGGPPFGGPPPANYPPPPGPTAPPGTPLMPAPVYGPAPAVPPPRQAPGVAEPQVPTGPIDPGFWVWLSQHGVTPGDPAVLNRLPEWMANYASLPSSDHAYYIGAGRADPGRYQFNVAGWPVEGLPSFDFGVPVAPPQAPGPVGEPRPAMPTDEQTYSIEPWLKMPGPRDGTEPPNRTPDQYVVTNAYTYAPPGVQAPVHEWNYAPTLNGTMQVYPPGVSSPYDTPDVSSATPMAPQTAYNLYQYGGGAARPAAPAPAYDPYNVGTPGTGVLLPNQINARNYENSYEYQQELGWAGFEDQGWDKGLAQQAYRRSLPQHAAPKSGSFAF